MALRRSSLFQRYQLNLHDLFPQTEKAPRAPAEAEGKEAGVWGVAGV